jgi:hypothetical protein
VVRLKNVCREERRQTVLASTKLKAETHLKLHREFLLPFLPLPLELPPVLIAKYDESLHDLATTEVGRADCC